MSGRYNRLQGRPQMPNISDLPIQKIAVLRALKFGDFLVAVPALRALRHAFPDAQIDYIGLPMTQTLVSRYTQYVDNFIPFPGFPPFPEQPFDAHMFSTFLETVQASSYDLVLQMQGNGKYANVLVSLFGARDIAGYASAETYWPNHSYFKDYPTGRHEILKLIDLLKFLGIEPQGTELEFPISAEDEERLNESFDFKVGSYMCIHPGSSSAERWSVENFASVGQHFLEAGYRVVITGTATEAEVTSKLMELLDERPTDLTDKTDFGSLAALLKGAALVVSNDTGTAHLANAVDAPSVTIFTTADPSLWAALDQTKHPYLTREEATPQQVIELAERCITSFSSKGENV